MGNMARGRNSTVWSFEQPRNYPILLPRRSRQLLALLDSSKYTQSAEKTDTAKKPFKRSWACPESRPAL